MNSDSLEPQPIRALSLLSAITMGNATIEDLAMELRQHGFDYSSLQFRRESPQELDSSIVQRVPQIPFVLNGSCTIRKTSYASTVRNCILF